MRGSLESARSGCGPPAPPSPGPPPQTAWGREIIPIRRVSSCVARALPSATGGPLPDGLFARSSQWPSTPPPTAGEGWGAPRVPCVSDGRRSGIEFSPSPHAVYGGRAGGWGAPAERGEILRRVMKPAATVREGSFASFQRRIHSLLEGARRASARAPALTLASCATASTEPALRAVRLDRAAASTAAAGSAVQTRVTGRLRIGERVDGASVGGGGAAHLAGQRVRGPGDAAGLRLPRRGGLRHRAQVRPHRPAGELGVRLAHARRRAGERPGVQAHRPVRRERVVDEPPPLRVSARVAAHPHAEAPGGVRLGPQGRRGDGLRRPAGDRRHGGDGREGDGLDRRPRPSASASPSRRTRSRPPSAPPLGDGALAIDADGATAWRSGGDDAWLSLDFLREREMGGLVLAWDSADFATDYALEASDDGARWEAAYAVRGGNGGRDPLYLPETETRHLRLRVRRSSRGQGVALRELDGAAGGVVADAERLLRQPGEGARRAGAYPRYLTGEQSYWTVVGVSGDTRESTINADGMVETGIGDAFHRALPVRGRPPVVVGGRAGVAVAGATDICRSRRWSGTAQPLTLAVTSYAAWQAGRVRRLCALPGGEPVAAGPGRHALPGAAAVPGEPAVAVPERAGRRGARARGGVRRRPGAR